MTYAAHSPHTAKERTPSRVTDAVPERSHATGAASPRSLETDRTTCPCGGGCPRCAADISGKAEGETDEDSIEGNFDGSEGRLFVGGADDPSEHQAARVAEAVVAGDQTPSLGY